MNIIKLAVVLALVIPATPLPAQSGHMKGMDADKKAQGTIHKGVGTVKNVDPAMFRRVK